MTYLKIIVTILSFFLFIRLLKLLYQKLPIPIIFKLLAISILVLIALKLLVFTMERIMPFVPSRRMELTPKDFCLKWKEARFTSQGKDAPLLHGWFISATKAPKATILFCHGNAGNISHRLSTAWALSEAGYNVFLFDYRGYGYSEGTPTEKGFYEDAKGAYDYLIKTEGLSPESIVFMGRSLGTGAALDLSLYKSPKALVLISPLTNTKTVARSILVYYPLSFFMSGLFDNEKKIPLVTCPVMIAHSPQDEILSYSMGKTLFEKAPEPKTFLELSGSHNDDYFADKAWLEKMDTFMMQKK